jgi:two-component system, chemotaxis family, protein-glutamate methylesterase/glutaminase
VPDREIIVIGASAGGVETLTQLVKRLPADLPAAICVSTHISSTTPSMLPQILTRVGKIPAIHPVNGEIIHPGIIYVAPPDYHLEVSLRHIHLSHGPVENGHRPAVDVMFRTAAESYGPRVIGIVLTGMLSDGSLGLQLIHEAGGVTIVQDPEDALFPSMPQNALQHVRVDAVLPLPEIAQEIIRLAGKQVEMEEIPQPLKLETKDTRDMDPVEPAKRDLRAFRNGKDTSPRSLITCPACGGVLWELNEEDQTFYYCQTGHRYSLESLFGEQTRNVESALWSAVRILEERAALTHRLAQKSKEKGLSHSYNQFLQSAEKADQDAEIIKQTLKHSSWTVGTHKTNGKTEDNNSDLPDGTFPQNI